MEEQQKEKFDFRGLFTLEMANNHQGSVEHGKKIIKSLAPIVKEAGVKAAIKFQFRDLDTIIHPAHKESSDSKHIPRFLSTRLSKEEFRELFDAAREEGFITMATPSDEVSVDVLNELGVEVIKIASAASVDWPLLEKVVKTGKPIICSTGGLSIEKVDNLFSFFTHRGANFALMHCVGIYPTPDHKLNLGRIKIFKERYSDVPIGYSTHEDPDNIDAIKIAYANGARLFERHIGIETDDIKLNAYSSRPDQVERWLSAYNDTLKLIGPGVSSKKFEDVEEIDSLASQMRGIYVSNAIKRGSVIGEADVFFAMPFQSKQLHSGQWKAGLIADRDYTVDQALSVKLLPTELKKKEVIYKAIHDVKGMLNISHIFVNDDSLVELMHPEGINNFFTAGSFVITCINRDYCKKIVAMLPGQQYPSHYHKKKEKTLQVISGQLKIDIAGRQKDLYPGETLLIPAGVWHGFQTFKGVIFEELSSDYPEDALVYADPKVSKEHNEEIATKLINWGRHQFDNE